jgi:hypothetical protein
MHRMHVRFALSFCVALGVGCGGEAAQAPAPRPTPAPQAAAGVRFIVGGDSRDDAAHVLPWAFGEAKSRGAAAFLFLGDMEISPQFDSHFEKELRQLEAVPFYPVLGNHEIQVLGFLSIGKKHAEKRFREHFLGTPRTPVQSSIPDEVVYSVNLAGGVHFIALDNVSQKGFGAKQLAWLASDLQAARADSSTLHVIVGMHKPLAHNGVSTHGMDGDGPQAIADSDAAVALFVKHKVSLILSSHVHAYAAFTHAGIPSFITGGLGAPLARSPAEGAFHHFLQLDVAADGIHVTTVRFPGAPIVEAEEGTD